MYANALYLAFDPSKSPRYKVVCVSSINLENQNGSYSAHFQIEIYTPETSSWRRSGQLFQPSLECDVVFSAGVYWNGAINFYSRWGDSMYFNVEEERLGIMPMPSMQEIEGMYERPTAYFGESGGHRVDLGGIITAFPETISDPLQPTDWYAYQFTILSVVQGETDKDEDSFLVLHVPGKVIRYNFADKTFNKQCDVTPYPNGEGMPVKESMRCAHFHSFHYIESLASV